MTDFIHAVVQLAAAHAGLVYVLAFVAACVESLAVVGLFMPGSGIIVALGALVPSGAVGFWWLCVWSILGAIAGDALSYWFGYYHRDRLKTMWPFNRHPRVLSHGERFFAAHGGKSVFLGRYVAPVRGAVPLVAGMAGMEPRRFLVVDAVSALGWAPAHIIPGVLLGAGLALTGAVASRLLIFVVVLLALLWLTVRLARLAVRYGLPLLETGQRRVDGWARQHDGWAARQLQALFDPARGEARALALLGVVLAAAAWTFFGVLEDVVSGDPLVRADTAIYNMLQGLRSLVADRVMIAVTELGGVTVTGAVVAAVLAWLLWRRAWHAAAYWIAAATGAGLIGLVIKAALHRARPAPFYTGWDAFSFPSGHATTSAAVYGFLAILLAYDTRPVKQVLAAVLAALMVALIGFSRLYLGAHWFSDVVGGIAFGTAWIALLAIAYVRHDPPRLPHLPLAALVFVTITVVGGVQIARKMPSDLTRYAAHRSERTMTPADWWRGGWRDLPLRRVDLAGEQEEPLVLQWAGSLDDLRRQLTAGGWRPVVPWSMESVLRWFDPKADPLSLPLLPRLHNGRSPALMMIRGDGAGDRPAGRWVLRVWQGGINLTAPQGGGHALWVAAITRQRFDGALAPFDTAFEKRRIAVPWRLLAAALPSASSAVRVDRPTGLKVMLAHAANIRTAARNGPVATVHSGDG